MTALPPHQLSQANRNAEDYRINCGVQEAMRGADGAHLIKRGYSVADIDKINERLVRQAKEIKID